jgi:hypothetical protein
VDFFVIFNCQGAKESGRDTLRARCPLRDNIFNRVSCYATIIELMFLFVKQN